MSLITNSISNRVGGKAFFTTKRDYKFLKIKNAKEYIKNKYPNIEIIDMGVGEPDLPANSLIVDRLCKEAGKSENRLYADNGIKEFKVAAAKYLRNVYSLKGIDADNEIMHGIGAKSILSMLPLCFINSGDYTITTIPGYPIIATHTRFLGGKVYNLPLYKKNNFYPNLDEIPNEVKRKAKLFYINYPNNPTGQVATTDFYKKIVEFAYENNIIIVSDVAYAPIVFDNYKPLSILSIDGAIEVCLEIHSLSKAFNMTGWRLAFIVSNSKVIDVYGNVKANIDSGQFRAVQKAGIAALNNPQLTHKIVDRYSRRFDLLVDALTEVGFNAEKPKGTFYCYVSIPTGTKSGIKFNNAEEASQYILKNAYVSTVPWDSAGAYLRFSVTFEAGNYEEEKKIINELKRRLLALDLVF